MLLGRNNQWVDVVFIGIHRASTIGFGDGLLQLLCRGFRTIPNGVSHNLAGPTAHRQPQPTFEELLGHKAHQFIKFQYVGGLNREQGRTEAW